MQLDQIEKYVLPEPIYNPIEFMSDQQLQQEQGNPFLFDVELFANFAFVAFKSYVTGRVLFFERSEWATLDVAKLRWVVENMLLVGFNSTKFDNLVLWAMIYGHSNEGLKALSDAIIIGNCKQYALEREFKFKVHDNNHIDLMQVAPSAAQFCSLKHYGGRMGVDKLQDLPVNPHEILTQETANIIRLYCVNDLDVTGWLYHKLIKPIELRQEMGLVYGSDLRSLSDAQIAERVISTEITATTGKTPSVPRIPQGTMFKYQNPAYLRFYTPDLQALHQSILDTDFIVDSTGKVAILKEGQAVSATNVWSVKIGQSKYKLGIGGLHSSEKRQTYFTDEKHTLFDRDVASYYPAIILNQKLFPAHIGPQFLHVYQDIVTRRLRAKADGDKSTANSLKICINGCFGKLGSKWSVFYSPELLVQVTISGQLSLLMLVEMLEWCRIPVVSANTDGIVIRCPQGRESDYLACVRDWERLTGFETEETRYASIHSRDVNNYIAIDHEGGIKAKGAYVNSLSMKDENRESLMKNPNGTICSEAVMQFLKTCNGPHPITIEETIKSCRDIRKFCFVRRVKGGAVKDRQYLGKIVRWYMRLNEFGCIRYLEANNAGNKSIVSESTGSYPIMNITGFPRDIDYGYYIRRAHSILKDVGYGCSEKQLDLF